ncbi:hypothetical protein [Helicobacter sp. MIT 14-3879]|uniref:hypothetical protein n=1 Tax=Helicobacter sp. MIT 14-3879 TaxID=2040649 RepID=UPI000E1F55AC|nr:hypothetical protein [Helicobacter sp. MIT 14-3879]RDU65180.1 hypothetical protein CQA44_02380 [Helicobacter sp. MIT 14-3879]
MEISTRLNHNIKEIKLNGKLESYNEYIEFKNTLKKELQDNKLNLYFINANSIDTSILGYILKLYEIDKIEINLVVSSSKLYNFLRNIEFNKFFDIKIKET